MAYWDSAALEPLAALLDALPRSPSSVGLSTDLGKLLARAGETDGAAACFERACALDPGGAGEARRRLEGLLRGGHIPRAGAQLTERLSLDGVLAFARALRGLGRMKEAIALCQQAIARSPRSTSAHNALGLCLLAMHREEEALAAFEQVVAIDPSPAIAHCNVATALIPLGRIEEACAAFRRALAIDPDYAECRSNLAYAMAFHPADDARAVLAEARAWNDRHAAPLAPTRPRHRNDRSPDRRLRVGYVSPDFRAHCQAFFTVPLFEHHDREAVEIVCYSTTPGTDSVTQRLRARADRWNEVRSLADEDVAALVTRDGIDVLVDLTMHMARGRPGIFARKPAPVQVCWLAYPGTTGLSAMDYRVTDRFIDPPGGNEEVYAEKSLRLPDTFWCYDPLTEGAAPAPLPAATRGHVTFGCLNNFSKIHDGVLALWARVMRAVADSRLVMRAPWGRTQERVLRLLGAHGIDPARVSLLSWMSRERYLETYQGIDVCLDTFPYGGHTTSLDALWMGVPVVTLVGRTVVGRAGLCYAENLGLTRLVASTEDDFVRGAVQLCSDLPRLAELRAGLRERMQRSPLMDAPRFARSLEAAYRQAWRSWCEQASD